MNEKEFRQYLRQHGYGEPQIIELEPNADGELHSHEFSALGMVIRGQAIIHFADHIKVDGPGDYTEIVAGVEHCEKAGPEGATVLLAFK